MVWGSPAKEEREGDRTREEEGQENNGREATENEKRKMEGKEKRNERIRLNMKGATWSELKPLAHTRGRGVNKHNQPRNTGSC